MNWTLVLLFLLIGCNSETPDLTSIQGVRDPGDPLPEIIHVAGPASGIYLLNGTIDFTVTFSEPVEVSGLPSLRLSLDSGLSSAQYLGGSGTNSLIFRKIINSGEYEVTGVTVNSNVSLNGGSIRSHFDQDPSLLNFSGLTFSGVLVDAAITEFDTMTGPVNGVYKAGDNLCFDLNYTAPVTVAGPLQMRLVINATSYFADYVSGSGTSDLRFCYPVPSDLLASGLTVSPSLTGGSLTDAFGSAVSNTIGSATYPSVVIDGIAPSIASETAPADRTFFTGEFVDFTVNFNEAVTVSGGTPTLQLTLTPGNILRSASYVSGAGSTSLVFRYQVQSGDPRRTVTPGTTFSFNGSSIRDLAGNFLSDNTVSFPATPSLKIDGSAPLLNGSPNFTTGGKVYRRGESITVSAGFNEVVYVTGSPFVTLMINGAAKNASYIGGSGTLTLLFQYFVEDNISDLDGIEIVGPINLNSGTIKDGTLPQANNANLSFATFSSPVHKVESLAYITGFSVQSISQNGSPEGSYKPIDSITLRLTYSENINVTGSPKLEFLMDGVTKQMTGSAVSGTEIDFSYTVQNGDFDMDGIEFLNSISLSGGATIKDSAQSQDVSLTLPDGISFLKFYLIPTELKYWFDLGSSASVLTDGGNEVTAIKDKASNFVSDGNVGATPPIWEDAGLGHMIRFRDPTPITFPSGIVMRNFVGVYRTGNTFTSNHRLFDYGTQHFLMVNELGTKKVKSGFSAGDYYNGATWVNSLYTLFYYWGGYTWNDEKRLVSLRGFSGTHFLELGTDYVNGEMYEIVIFDVPPSDNTLEKVYNYLAYKHQVDFGGQANVPPEGL